MIQINVWAWYGHGHTCDHGDKDTCNCMFMYDYAIDSFTKYNWYFNVLNFCNQRISFSLVVYLIFILLLYASFYQN
jgi:hypothetical protein